MGSGPMLCCCSRPLGCLTFTPPTHTPCLDDAGDAQKEINTKAILAFKKALDITVNLSHQCLGMRAQFIEPIYIEEGSRIEPQYNVKNC